jgi:putative flippase GtrA
MFIRLRLNRRFLKFLILGIWNTTFGYLLFIALLNIDFFERHTSWALILTYAISSVQTFLVQKTFVWNDSSHWTLLAGPFALASVCAYALNQTLFIIGIEWIDLDPRIAQLFAIPFVVIVSYTLLNRLVFSRGSTPE